MSKSNNSTERVLKKAQEMGLTINIERMPASTRTAQEAATACNCDIAQIVKSLIFTGRNSGELKLFLVSGAHQIDPAKAESALGEGLLRADPKTVRLVSGFAIGGVAPIAHLQPIETWFDKTLLDFERVWAAAGAPNAVFAIDPRKLLTATGAKCLQVH